MKDMVPGHTKDLLSLLINSSEYVALPDRPVLLRECDTFSELFCVNPLDGVTDHNPVKSYHSPDKPRRADLNVTAFRNFIFESDTDTLEAQQCALEKLMDIIRLSVFSANKSISLIVSVADTLPFKPHTEAGVHDAKLAWNGLRAHIEALTGLKLDPATKNPSRLTRTPGVVRADTGKVQQALYTGPLVTSDWVLSHMTAAMRPTKAYYAPVDASTYSAFERLLATEQVYKGLRNKLQNAHVWAAPAHMYPEILRLTLWAIDATGAPLDVLREYMWRYTFPALLEVGYERSKIEEGLVNAYKYKGLI